MSMEPIAIVGKGCVLPTGLGSSALWDAVVSAQLCITEVPHDRWGIEQGKVLCNPDRPLPEYSWSNKGGYVPSEYHPAREDLDPVFIWTKQASEQALSNVQRVEAHRTGLVLGNLSFPTAKMNQYTEWRIGKRENVDERNRFMSGLPARWTAEQLNILGPAYALDCACASARHACA